LYDSEGWTIKAKDKGRSISVEMKFMQRTVGYIWSDFKQNTEILELKVTPHSRKMGEIM
jgi:DTW domain-containing protein YfiP